MNKYLLEALGKCVRDAWIACKQEELEAGGKVPADHLLPWNKLDERNQEIDRRIAEAVVNDLHYGKIKVNVACRNCTTPLQYEIFLDQVEAHCEDGYLTMPEGCTLTCHRCNREYTHDSAMIKIESVEV